jgi:hypothetical protein
MVSVAPYGVVMVSLTGLGRWRVAELPPEVRTVTEVSEKGTAVVVVPPDGVSTCETVTDEATETVAVPPFEVTYETDETGVLDDGVLTKDEVGTTTVTPDSVTYGVLNAGAGVYTVSVEPDGVVIVSEIGLGRWRVAELPPEVSMEIEVTVDGMVVVVVPPDGVMTCDTTGEEAYEIDAVPPLEVTSTTDETLEGVHDGVVYETLGEDSSHGS